MKQNLFRISVRFNLNNPEHAEIVSILKNLNKNFHTTENAFIIEALTFYIRNMSSDTLTGDGREAGGKRATDYATHEYVDTNLKALEQALRLFVYEKLEGIGGGVAPRFSENRGTVQAGSQEEKEADKDVDLSQFDTIMNDIDQWTK